MRVKTDCKYWGGYGDVCCMAWAAEAAKGTAHPLEIVATGVKADLLRLLGQFPIEDKTGAVDPSDAYRIELAARCEMPRLWYFCNWLGCKDGWKRPPYVPDEKATFQAQLKFAAWSRQKGTRRDRPVVLLFPKTHWQARAYPPAFWIDVAWQLQKLGIAPVVMLDKEDKALSNVPFWIAGRPIAEVAALMRMASVVVGNDSGPAHIAGTLGAKTIALMGPTSNNVFAHCENITCLRSDLPCGGCHFGGEFRAACDQACRALMTLMPETVVEAIMKNVNGG